MSPPRHQNSEQFTDNHVPEYNEIQCDKRNAYRRKVKEEKAAATPAENGEGTESSNAVAGPGASNGDPIVLIDPSSDAAERPAKKLKGDDGEALQADDEDPDDVENDDTEMNQDADEQDEEAEDDDVDDEEGSDGSDDDPMEDAREHLDEERGELRDEALDEPDSD